MKSVLDSVIRSRFPPLAFACGYGSGVFKQAQSTSGKMVDTIFVVRDGADWHEKNRVQNPSDYAFVPRYLLSSKLIESAQRDFGGRIWFNTLIPCQTQVGNIMLKYGVISLPDFILDLNEWETMYIAGRLQKPVLELEPTEQLTIADSEIIRSAINKNREHALKTALALLSGTNGFSSSSLIEEIVGLSYGGDIRVGLAESPTKVKDIVSGSNQELCDLYFTSDLGKHLVSVSDDGRLHNVQSFPELVAALPTSLSEVKDKVELRKKLSTIVRSSSTSQTLKGVLTAGLGKSVRYGLSKVRKRLSFNP